MSGTQTAAQRRRRPGWLSPAGTALYADGALVASNAAVTTAQNHTGYWRVGYDNLTGLARRHREPLLHREPRLRGRVPVVLSATQVAAHYRAGTA